MPPPEPGQVTLLKLVCLDDDNQGRPLEVLWELEFGARLIAPEATGLGKVEGLDSPRAFGAYLHALKWNAVTATDAQLFQAPFRAGIQLFDYQLTPLRKALQLRRANLFGADDVGLGKTIEAGLVFQGCSSASRRNTRSSSAPPPSRPSGATRCSSASAVSSRPALVPWSPRRPRERGYAAPSRPRYNHLLTSDRHVGYREVHERVFSSRHPATRRYALEVCRRASRAG